MTTHYDTLGVPKDASADEIKRAYRRKSSKAHPDKGGSQQAMQRINAAYAVLSDEAKRAHYDQTGQDHQQSADAAAQAELLSLFNALLENEEIVDLLDSARNAVKAKIKSIETNIALGRQRVGAIERKRGKVRRRDAGPNAVDMLIEQKVTHIKDAIRSLTEALEVVLRTQDLLASYESTDPPTDFRPDPIYRSMFFTADFLKGM